jgi:hypothetical protein
VQHTFTLRINPSPCFSSLVHDADKAAVNACGGNDTVLYKDGAYNPGR